MITKKDILKMVRVVHKRAQGGVQRRIIHPYREWGIGVLITTALFVVGVVYSGYVYTKFDTIENRLDTPAPKVIRYQENTIERVRDFYSERRADYEAMLTSSSQVQVFESATTTQSTRVVEATASTTPTTDVSVAEEIQDVSTESLSVE